MSWKEGSKGKFFHSCAICSFKNVLLPTGLRGFWRGRALPEALWVSLLKRHCQEFIFFRNPVCSFFFFPGFFLLLFSFFLLLFVRLTQTFPLLSYSPPSLAACSSLTQLVQLEGHCSWWCLDYLEEKPSSLKFSCWAFFISLAHSFLSLKVLLFLAFSCNAWRKVKGSEFLVAEQRNWLHAKRCHNVLTKPTR